MFPKVNPTHTKAWQKLKTHFLADRHLLDKEDIGVFQKEMPGRFKVDYQFGLWNEEALELLLELAEECELPKAIDALFSGEKINETENRAVLHTALRDFSPLPVYVDGENVKPMVLAERAKMKQFVNQVHNGEILGSTRKRIKYIVNIGIGGSAIGPRMIVKALGKYRQTGIQVHYISSIEAGPIVALLESLDLEETLFLMASKTFTTLETMTNANLVKEYFIDQLGEDNWSKHIVGVTTQTDKTISFGIPESRVFLFWD